MDIGNMSAMTDYVTDTATNASQVNSSALKSKDYAKATDEELMDACKEFEAYFLEQVFKEMWKSVPRQESDSAATSTLTEYFQDEMIKELSADAVDQNSTGLAQSLYEQMKRNYDI